MHWPLRFRLRSLFMLVSLAAGLSFMWRLGAATGTLATIALSSTTGAIVVYRGGLRPGNRNSPDLTMFLGGALGGAIAAMALVWSIGILTMIDAGLVKEQFAILFGCGMLSMFGALYGAAVGGAIGAVTSCLMASLGVERRRPSAER